MSNKWYDDSGIIIEDMKSLLDEANKNQFGETESETLTSFLLCEAFESRYDKDRQRAFHLAAMIISRAS